MPAVQTFGRSAHSGGVQGVAALMTITTKERVRRRAVVNDVPVQLSLGVAIGVERLWHLGRFSDNYIGWQMSIQGPRKNIWGMAASRVEVNDLPDSMNPSVRAAAGVSVNSFLC
jgi:hypothetical protein